MAFPPQIVVQATGLALELNLRIGDINGPVSYVTGGVVLGASAFGLPTGLYFVKAMDATVSGTYEIFFNSISGARGSTVKVRFFVVSSGLEVGNGTNLSAEKFRYAAYGV